MGLARQTLRERPASRSFLPRSKGARVLVAVLALPSFIVSTGLLVAFTFAIGQAGGIAGIVGMIVMGEILFLASSFTFLALLWAVAAPQWVAYLLEARVRPLLLVTGVFLVVNGAFLVGLNVMARQFTAAVMMSACVLVGAAILCKGALMPRA